MSIKYGGRYFFNWKSMESHPVVIILDIVYSDPIGKAVAILSWYKANWMPPCKWQHPLWDGRSVHFSNVAQVKSLVIDCYEGVRYLWVELNRMASVWVGIICNEKAIQSIIICKKEVDSPPPRICNVKKLRCHWSVQLLNSSTFHCASRSSQVYLSFRWL